MLPEMLAGFLGDPDCAEVWLTCHAGGRAVGFCFAEPEQMTQGAWNTLAIALDRGRHGKGHGGALVAALEARLKDRDGRITVADTSGTNAFAETCAFYAAKGYAQEARIRDFWVPGDDKIVL